MRTTSQQPTTGTFRVQEFMPAAEAVWKDNPDGLPQAEVVIIRPGESANRRMYSREAIQDAVNRDFWGGTPMFVDHGDKNMPRKRSFRDLGARIEPGTSYVGAEGEARAIVTFIERPLAQKVKDAGPSAGLSAVHEFMGQRFRGNDGHMHERVDKFVVPHSVDFVVFPAAGGEVSAFLGAQESEDDVDWKDLTPEMLAEHRPDLVAAISASEADDPDDGEGDEGNPPRKPAPQPDPPQGYVSLEQVRSIVQEQVETVHTSYQEQERKRKDARAAVTAHVNKAGLPEKTKSKLIAAFEDQTEYNAKAVQEAIDEAAEQLSEVGWRGPVVRGLGDSTAQESDDKGADPDTLKQLYPTMMAVEESLDFKPRTGKAN